MSYTTTELKREKLRRKLLALEEDAKTDFLSFSRYVGRSYYTPIWHHKAIAKTLQNFLNDPEQNRLMLFVPPQHGKSQLASRFYPAYILGRLPDHQIVISSYSADLAKSFNEDVQRIMQSGDYLRLFPSTELSKCKGEETALENGKGKIRAVGVTGGLTGHSVDLAIIDDPVKDDIEAQSKTYRERVWQWYLKVLETRLHTNSKVVFIMTRWHEDDLAGRLLRTEPEKWAVVKFPAIKEDFDNPDDPRQIGEALWPEKHSLESLLDKRRKSETTFASLYQQRPAPAEGNKIKRDWFQFCHEKEVPGDIVWDLWVDGAYTKSTANDPTGLMVAGYHRQSKKLYIRFAHAAHLEMPQLLKLVQEVSEAQGLAHRSRVFIEPKASGKTLKQLLVAQTNLSAVEIKNQLVQEGKEGRIQAAAPKAEAGRVVIVKGSWNDSFLTQICSFPNATHDEFVDLIGYASFHYMPPNAETKGVKYR